MKRIISVFIIISLICLSVCAVHAYSTANNNLEIELLRAMDILEGEYRPTQPVTRAEMANIAVGLANMKNIVIPFKEAIFTDVRTDNKYYNAISAAYNLKYMRGCGDGLFKPDDIILIEHTKSVLMSVLGYNKFDSLYKTSGVNLMKNVGQAENGTANQEIVYKMVFNALNTKVLEYNGLEYEISDETMLEKVFKIKKVRGIVTADEITSLDKTDAAGDDRIMIDNTIYYYYGNEQLIGNRVEAYYREDGDKSPEILVIEKKNYKEITVSDVDIESAELKNGVKLSYSIGDDKIRTITTINNPTIIFNGKVIDFADVTAEDFCLSNGEITLIKNGDNNNDYNVVVISNGVSVMVKGVSYSENTVYFEYGVKINGIQTEKMSFYRAVNDGKFKLTDDNNEARQFSDIKKGCVLTIYKAPGNEKEISAVVSNHSVNGVITLKENGTNDNIIIEIDGTRYRISKEYQSYTSSVKGEFKLGIEGTFYLNERNKIVYSNVISGGEKIYGYLVNMGVVDGFDKNVSMKVFTEKNKMEIFPLKDRVIFNEGGVHHGKIDSYSVFESFFEEPEVIYRDILYADTQFKSFPAGITITKDMLGDNCLDMSDNLVIAPLDAQNDTRFGIYAPSATGWITYKITSESADGFDNLQLKYSGRSILTSHMRVFIGDEENNLSKLDDEWPQELQSQNRVVDLTDYAQGKNEIYLKIEIDNNETDNTWAWLEDIRISEKVAVVDSGVEEKQRDMYSIEFEDYARDASVTNEMLGDECVEFSDNLKIHCLSPFLKNRIGVCAKNESAYIIYKISSAGDDGFNKLYLTYSGRAINNSRMEFYVGTSKDSLQKVQSASPEKNPEIDKKVELSDYVRSSKEAYVKIVIDNTGIDNTYAWLENLKFSETYIENKAMMPIKEKFDKKKMQLIRFKLNGDRMVTMIETAKNVNRTHMYDDVLLNNDIFRTLGGKEKRRYYKYGRAFDGTTSKRVLADSSTICFDVPGDPTESEPDIMEDYDKYNVRTWNCGDGEYEVSVFDVNEFGIASAVVCYASGTRRTEFDEAKNFSVVKNVNYIYDEIDENSVEKMTVINSSGQEEAYYQKEGSENVFRRKLDGQNFKFGDIVQFGNEEHEVSSDNLFNVIYTVGELGTRDGMTYTDPEKQSPNPDGAMPAYGNESSLLRIMTGVVQNCETNYIKVNKGTNFDEPETWYVANGCPVMEVDLKTKTVKPIGLDEINKGDFVVLRQQWSMVMQIIKYIE